MVALVDLSDPSAFVDAPPHAMLEELRRTQPVYWQEMAGEPGFWAVLKHADVVHVAREPRLFSAEEGGVVLENLAPEQLAMMRNMLLAMDPPRHVAYRKPLAPRFKARVIDRMEGDIRVICREIMEAAAAKGEVEFVHEVAGPLPTRVIGQLVGIPPEDQDQIHRWAEQNTSGQDPELAGAGYQEGNPSVDMAMYAIGFAARRRQEAPREDLTSLILAGNFGGQPMSDMDFGSFFVQLVTAGNDTTKTMLSGGVLALLEHPDQLAELRADPSLIPGAVEEILRWANPLHYFRRTATADTTVRGVPIAAGDKVAHVLHVGQPRRGGVRRPAPLRHPPLAEPAPVLRDRRAFLPRRAPRPPRGPHLHRGAAGAVPDDRAHRPGTPHPVQPQQRAEGPPAPPRRLTPAGRGARRLCVVTAARSPSRSRAPRPGTS